MFTHPKHSEFTMIFTKMLNFYSFRQRFERSHVYLHGSLYDSQSGANHAKKNPTKNENRNNSWSFN